MSTTIYRMVLGDCIGGDFVTLVMYINLLKERRSFITFTFKCVLTRKMGALRETREHA